MKIIVEYEDGRRIEVETDYMSPAEVFRLIDKSPLTIKSWNGKPLWGMFATEKE